METKSQKWCIHPTTSQAKTLKLWLDGARYAYNLAVEYVNETKKYDKRMLREGAGAGTGAKMPTKDMVTGMKIKQERIDDPWHKRAPERLWSVPAKIRDAAVIDVHKACVALVAKEHRLTRALRFRASKDRQQSMYLESLVLNNKTTKSIYAPLFGTVKDRSAMRTEKGKCLPSTFSSDCRVCYERHTDRWYICMSVKIEKVLENVPETQGRDTKYIVSIDPGIRTYATCYDPERGCIAEWALTGGRKNGLSKGSELAGWLTRKIGRLEQHARQVHGRHRRRVRALADRKRQKLIHLANELHHELALWLCRNYDVVLLPKFSVKQISRRKKRVLGRNTIRRLSQMSPFRFRMFLLHKAREYGTTVEICDEKYTSQTCTVCGVLNRKLGSAKIFLCGACGSQYDRDHGAARNILLRYISLNNIGMDENIREDRERSLSSETSCKVLKDFPRL